MRYLLILCLSISLYAKGQTTLLPQLILTSRLDSLGHGPGSSTDLYVTITIANTGPDTIRYYSMSCSYYEVFISGNKNIPMYGWACDKNVTTIITIPPQKTDTKKLILNSNLSKEQLNKEKFKVGLIYMPSNKTNLRNDWEEMREGLKERKTIIWSNEVIIK
jgi:hypothetical protein